MQPMSRMLAFADRHPAAGPVAWLLSIQFFIVQVVVASVWKPPYSWRLNAISDLGATSCGRFDDRFVCSPLHGLMNGSLVLLGLCMTMGSPLLYQALRSRRVGFSLMAVAGAGAIVVGIYPEDTLFWAHITGQDLAFLFGNIALIVIGSSRRLPRWVRWYSGASGVVALVGLHLFLSHHRFFLGLGGMERVVAYPLTIWLIVLGTYMWNSRNHVPFDRINGTTTRKGVVDAT